MKYEYNEELDKDVLHLPLFSNNILNRISDILTIFNDGGKNNNNLLSADDMALLAGNENNFQSKQLKYKKWENSSE